MIATVPPLSIDELHARFSTVSLPRVESHAALVFRNRNAEEKSELLADAVALACYGDCWIMRN